MGRHKRKSGAFYAGLVGKEVLIPLEAVPSRIHSALIVTDQVFQGVVQGPDSANKGCVIVKPRLKEPSRGRQSVKLFFRADLVRSWLEQPNVKQTRHVADDDRREEDTDQEQSPTKKARQQAPSEPLPRQSLPSNAFQPALLPKAAVSGNMGFQGHNAQREVKHGTTRDASNLIQQHAATTNAAKAVPACNPNAVKPQYIQGLHQYSPLDANTSVNPCSQPTPQPGEYCFTFLPGKVVARYTSNIPIENACSSDTGHADVYHKTETNAKQLPSQNDISRLGSISVPENQQPKQQQQQQQQQQPQQPQQQQPQQQQPPPPPPPPPPSQQQQQQPAVVSSQQQPESHDLLKQPTLPKINILREALRQPITPLSNGKKSKRIRRSLPVNNQTTASEQGDSLSGKGKSTQTEASQHTTDTGTTATTRDPAPATTQPEPQVEPQQSSPPHRQRSYHDMLVQAVQRNQKQKQEQRHNEHHPTQAETEDVGAHTAQHGEQVVKQQVQQQHHHEQQLPLQMHDKDDEEKLSETSRNSELGPKRESNVQSARLGNQDDRQLQTSSHDRSPEPADDTGVGKWDKPRKGVTRKAQVADILGKVFYIPGPVFGVDIPDMYYRAKVIGPDSKHQDAAVIQLIDDRDKYFFPIGQVREWLAKSEGRARITGKRSDEFAAEVLAAMHAGLKPSQSISHASSKGGKQSSSDDMDVD